MTVKTMGRLNDFGVTDAVLRIEGNIQTLKGNLADIDKQIEAIEGEQEQLAYRMSTASNADARKKELKIERLDRTLDRLKKKRTRTTQALDGAKRTLADERESMARAKAEAQIAITRRHIEYELKNTLNRDREELSMLDRSSDPRQVAVIRARMDQYSDALIAIEEGRLRITTDDSVNTFLNRLSERLREAEKEKVTVLQGAA